MLKNSGSDIRTLSGDGDTLVYDQLGEIYLFDTATGKSHHVPIEVDADLPEVRPHIQSVADEIENVSISPTGVRAVVEAHGEIFTVAAKHGPTRDITNTPGVDGARAGLVARRPIHRLLLRRVGALPALTSRRKPAMPWPAPRR